MRVKHRRLLIALAIGLCLLAGCGSDSPEVDDQSQAAPPPAGSNFEPDQDPVGQSIEEIVAGYKKYRKITPEPVEVSPLMIYFCRPMIVDPEKIQREIEENPHNHAEIEIYMNETAAAAFESGGKTYGEGAVIVKSKGPILDRRVGTDESTGEEKESDPMVRHERPEGVGGMVKRQKGYAPEHGDWEYFYLEKPDNKVEHGLIRSCADCHAKARDSDYVFGRWGERVDFEGSYDGY